MMSQLKKIRCIGWFFKNVQMVVLHAPLPPQTPSGFSRQPADRHLTAVYRDHISLYYLLSFVRFV